MSHYSVLDGWKQFLMGVWLLMIGSMLDITDNFPALNAHIIIGDTPAESFLEKIVCYLGGFIYMFIGFARWIPLITELHAT